MLFSRTYASHSLIIVGFYSRLHRWLQGPCSPVGLLHPVALLQPTGTTKSRLTLASWESAVTYDALLQNLRFPLQQWDFSLQLNPVVLWVPVLPAALGRPVAQLAQVQANPSFCGIKWLA